MSRFDILVKVFTAVDECTPEVARHHVLSWVLKRRSQGYFEQLPDTWAPAILASVLDGTEQTRQEARR